MSPRHWLCLMLLLGAGAAFAQSADQEVVSATDSVDPVVPGNNFSYTVVVRNNGPDPATNGGLNINFGSAVTHVSHSLPPGWQCFFNGGNASCITPSFSAGTTATITLVVQMAPHLINFPDGSTSSNFFTSGVTSDPNNGNNARSVGTNWNSPQMDLAIAVTDTPDPVGPDQDLTYTATVTNAGPDAATQLNFNVYNPGYVPFKSVLPPVGWTCTPPAVGAATIFTCNTASFAAGATSVFSVVVRVDDAILGLNNGTISTVIGVNGTGDDTNDNNNNENEDTAYVTPKADLAITVDDLPDPVMLGQDIEFLVTMTNLGAAAAPNASMSFYNNGTLRFQSVVAPAGYQCTPPTVGTAPIFSCTTASMAVGATAEMIVTVRTDPQLINATLGGTVQSVVTAGSGVADPVNANNVENESTLVIPVLLFSNGFEP